MKESAKCSSCNNVNEVKVSSGFNKPENKGRRYFTCVGCGQFTWVSGDQLVASPTPPVTNPGNLNQVNSPDPSVWEEKDKRIAREAAVHALSRVMAAKITTYTTEQEPSLRDLTGKLIIQAERLVEYYYTGKDPFQKPLDEFSGEELDKIAQEAVGSI